MVDDIARLREHLTRRETRVSTHWDGCIDSHPICALAWALDEIEQLQHHTEHLAEGLRQWNIFANEYMPTLMARPGSTALRNWETRND